MRVFCRLVFFAAALCVACAMAWAQTGNATLSGTVTDPSGAVVPGAMVKVTNTLTGVAKTTVTTSAGLYSVQNLIPGPYVLEVSAKGFERKVVSGITLVVDQQASVNVQVRVGSTNQVVTVSGAATAALQTTNASVGSVIGSQEVADLPLNGRNFTQLLQLSPGASSSVTTYLFSTSNYTTTGLQRNGMPEFNVNGGNAAYVSYRLDGSDNNESEFGGANIPVSIDAIQEVNIQTADFSAEYGHGPAQVEVVTKSGTNQIHGTLFEFVRNDALDATEWTLTGPHLVNLLKRNQFGGSIGGPIKKDKLFYFFDYDGTRQNLSEPETATLPTVDMRNGVFPSGDVITNPATNTPFLNNTIPASSMSSGGMKMLAVFPTPNQPGIAQVNKAGFALPPTLNYAYDPRQTRTINQYNGRVDYTISSKDSFFARFTADRNFILADGPLASNLPGVDGVEQDNFSGYNLSTSWIHDFTPTMINEFVAAFDTDPQQYNSVGPVATTDYASQFGIQQFLNPNAPVGLPTITLTGFTSVGAGNTRPYHVSERNFQLLDNLTFIRGPHQIKFGFDGLRAYRLPFDVERSRGVFDFTGVQTRNRNLPSLSTTYCPGGTVDTACSAGSGAADILLGYPSEVILGGPELSPWRHWSQLAGYVWDTWRVTKTLTINLGFRYDYQTQLTSNPPAFSVPLTENGQFTGVLAVANTANGQITPLIPASNLALVPSGEIVTCRSVGLPDNCVYPITNEWQPRLGFAWMIGNKTVIRGGGGVFYGDVFGFSQSEEGTSSFPFVFARESADYTKPPSGTTPPPLSLTNPLGTSAGEVGALELDANSWPREKGPASYQWNLTVQRQLTSNTLLSVGYIATLNRHLYPEPDGICCYWNIPEPIGVVLAPGQQQVTAAPNIAVDETEEYNGTSNYNSLQVEVRRRFSHGLGLTFSYTYSKALADWQNLSDPLNSAIDYGPYEGDLRHNLVFSPIWQLPFGSGQRWLNRKGPINQVLGGWRLSGILSLRSGFPFTPTLSGVDLLNDPYVYENRPDRTCSGTISNPTPLNWFNKNCFTMPVEPTTPGAALVPGNSAYDILSGPGGFDLDMGIAKTFLFTERYSLEFRFESFNFTNTPSLALPGAGIVPGNNTPAEISTTESTPRELQFALKLHF